MLKYMQKELIKKPGDALYKILSDSTDKSIEQIAKDCDRDYFLTSEEAKGYKLIDSIIDKRIPAK